MNESPASGGGGRRRSGLQALSAPQAARLRARFSELVDEHGSEIEVARRVGISQQSVNKIRHGAPIGLEVAKRLCISSTTVRHHLTSIFEKLDVSNRMELMRCMFEGVVDEAGTPALVAMR